MQTDLTRIAAFANFVIWSCAAFGGPCILAELGSVPTSGQPNGVVLRSNIAYLADGTSGLKLYELTDPSSPALIGAISTAGNAQDIAVGDDLVAYIADGVNGIVAVDVSTPPFLAELGNVALPGRDHTVVELGPAGIVFAVDGTLENVLVVNVADPSSMAIIATVPLQDGVVEGLAYQGSTLYAATASNGIRIIDVSNPAAPIAGDRVGTFTRSVFVSGNRLLSGGSRLQSLGIVDPQSPELFGEVVVPFGISEVSALEWTAFTASETAGVSVIDFTDPVAPRVIGGADSVASEEIVSLAAEGSILVCADLVGGLRVFDISSCRSCVADMTTPDDVLDFSDALVFLSAFTSQSLAADLVAPFGSWDFQDVLYWLTEFAAGCP